MDIAIECSAILGASGIKTAPIESNVRAIAFEGETVIGFVLEYPTVSDLKLQWQSESQALIHAHQFALRRAQAKAFNTYVVLLSKGGPSYADVVALSAIEEDLNATRKIARAGISDVEALRSALLPLLPIQSSPRLEAIDMVAEIRLRTTELPDRAVEAFLSGAAVSDVILILEDLR